MPKERRQKRPSRGRKELTLVVRLWAEDDPTKEESWRGQVEHVPLGEKKYFKDLEQLLQIIRHELGISSS